MSIATHFRLGNQAVGVASVTLSAVLWSTAGLFVRMADLDAWTVLGWRSLFSALFLAVCAAGRRASARPIMSRLRGPELFLVVTAVLATICYVFALELTTVANVMTVYATLPFVTAGVAFVWIGERADRRLLVASAIAFVGIVIMAGSVSAPREIVGNLAAFIMTLGFGLQLVHVKRHPDTDTIFTMAVAAAACALVSWPLMAVPLPSLFQIATLAAFGIITTGIGYTLALEGGRRIGSGEAGFISMLDVVLGPLWVWLAFAETPAGSVLLGGILVLAAVVWYLWRGLRQPAAQSC